MDVESKLTWKPGMRAIAHRVSLSTDFDVANDPNSGVSCGDVQFDPVPLEPGRTYYWRVDESDGSRWHKGGVWSFTAADVIVVDDFESYTNDSPNRVFVTWMDGWGASLEEDYWWIRLYGNGTGATAGHDPAVRPIMELDIVHGGLQSLPLYYDNTGSESLPYSQIEAILGPCKRPCVSQPLAVTQNWAGHGVKFLSLWFHGDVNNAPEPLYLGVEDGDKHLKVVDYPGGPAATRVTQWRQWCIDLQEFAAAGVNLAQVGRIVIGLGNPRIFTPGGTGLLYIDDIQLHPRAERTTACGSHVEASETPLSRPCLSL